MDHEIHLNDILGQYLGILIISPRLITTSGCWYLTRQSLGPEGPQPQVRVDAGLSSIIGMAKQATLLIEISLCSWSGH